MSHHKTSKTNIQRADSSDGYRPQATLIKKVYDQDDFSNDERTFDLKYDEAPTLKMMPDQQDQLTQDYAKNEVLQEHASHQSMTSTPHGIFDYISSDLKDTLMQEGARMRYLQGQAMNDIGEPCKGLSLVMKGVARVDVMDALQWVTVDALESGDMFGAMEWLEAKKWEERVMAMTDVETLFITTDKLKSLSTRHPELRIQLERYHQRHHLQALLGTHELFQKVDAKSLKYLIDIANVRPMRKGARIFDPLTRISTLFVIGQGIVELSYQEQTVQQLRAGDLLNIELALGDGFNELSAYAITHGYLYMIPFEDIEVTLAQTGWLAHLQALALHRRKRAKRID